MILHIGIPKTATSFLQGHLLPRIDGIDYLGKTYHQGNTKAGGLPNEMPGWCWRLRSNFKLPNTVWYGQEATWLRQCLLNQKQRRNSPFLVSHELFFGKAIPGIFVEGAAPYDVRHVTGHLNALSRRVLPDQLELRILVTVRRQDTWLSSAYAQASTRIEDSGQEDFEAQVRECLDKSLYEKAAFLDYSLFYDALEEAVGAGNVLFLFQEELECDPQSFVRRLQSFAGVEAEEVSIPSVEDNKKRKTDQEWNVRELTFSKRVYRTLFPRSFRRKVSYLRERVGLMGYSGSITLREDTSRYILDRFAESNRALAEDVETDIEAFGYY